MADELKATPRNALLGLLADALSGANDYAQRADRTMPGGRANPVLALLADNIGLPGAARTADRLSYGEPVTNIGKANVPLLPSDTADALMLGSSVAPFVSRGMLKASDAAVRAISGNPAATATGVLDYARGMAPALNPATVWHGSPHKFDKFDSSKIGTGEGAQAYGHGLYLADNPEVAKSYLNAGGDGEFLTVTFKNGQQLYGDALTDKHLDAIKALEMGANRAGQFKHNTAYYAKQMTSDPEVESLIDAMNGARIGYQKHQSLYKVDLPDSAIAKMLDWDKPLSQQEVPRSLVNEVGSHRWNLGNMPDDPTGQQFVQALQRMGLEGRKGSERLREAGIPGIRYLDGGSRGAGAGTSNYVVFAGEEPLLTILERNGVPLNALQEAARGR